MFSRFLASGALGLGLVACSATPEPAPGIGAATAPAPVRVERRLGAMGTWLDLQVSAASRASALQASERAVRAIEAVEARLSTWTEDTELARLNRAPLHRSVALSPELAADLERARELQRATGGAFDPGVGRLVQAWGLREGGRRPGAEEQARALEAVGLDSLELFGDQAIRRKAVVLEEGGFGKGVGLDAALASLAGTEAVAATIDLGGQVALFGRTGPMWFGVADPRARDRIVLELEIEHGSLATTGNSERGVVVDGERLSHVLDPRTGRPAPDFGSVTVWAPDATTADALSTGLFVMGPEEALAWAERHAEIEVVLLLAHEDGLTARATPGLRGRLRTCVDDVDVFFSPSAKKGAVSTNP